MDHSFISWGCLYGKVTLWNKNLKGLTQNMTHITHNSMIQHITTQNSSPSLRPSTRKTVSRQIIHKAATIDSRERWKSYPKIYSKSPAQIRSIDFFQSSLPWLITHVFLTWLLVSTIHQEMNGGVSNHVQVMTCWLVTWCAYNQYSVYSSKYSETVAWQSCMLQHEG